MPLSPFLAVNCRNGTPQVERWVNAIPAFIGVPITGATGDTDGTNINIPRGYTAAIKFGGSQTFVVTVGQAIHRTTDGGGTWTQVWDLTPYTSGGFSVAKSGLFVLHVGGVATAVLVTFKFSNTYYAHKSTDGVTWATAGPFATGATNPYYNNDTVVWNGRLVTIWNSSSNEDTLSTVYDPVTDTMSMATMGSFGGAFHGSGSLCVFNDRLFSVMRSFAGASSTRILELVAGTWVTINAFTSTTGDATSKTCMFVDGAFLYAFVTVGAAWQCFQWSSAMGGPTNISGAVVPTALSSGMAAGARMSVIIDDRAVPGTAPTIWLHQSVDGTAGSAINQWKWNGPSQFIGTLPGSAGSGPNSTGGSARDNLPFTHEAQGVTFWTSGEDHLEMKGVTPIVGGISVAFVLYSDDGLGVASVRAWQGVATDEYPLAAATLTGTTTGLAKDNVTVHSVAWQAATDGFASGDVAKFIMEKF